jgi:excisionase family DNA binding protein
VTNALSVADLRAVTTVTIAQAGAFLSLSQATAYRAAADGGLPTIQVGKHRRVPTPLLLALVGIPWEAKDEPDPCGRAS